jgi:hypothetical protein
MVITKPKRRLPPGRAFERLVSRIESNLARKGVVIKSPDSLPDSVVGGTREVDVSMRSTVGSAEVLVIIECRDRSRSQDITWIEQVRSKREAVGASMAIAVSSRPFSKKAVRAAQRYGIEIRVVSRVSDEDIQRWAGLLQVSTEHIRYNDRSVTIELFGEEVICRGALDWITELTRERGFGANFLTGRNNDLMSPLDFIRGTIKTTARKGPQSSPLEITLPPKSGIRLGNDPARQVLVGNDDLAQGSPVRKQLLIEFEEGDASVRWDGADFRVQRLTLNYEVELVTRTPVDPRTFRYTSPSGTVADVSEHSASIAGTEIIIVNRRAGPELPEGPS